MRTKQGNIYSYKLKSQIHSFFVEYRKIFYVLALISLLAILTACFTVTKYSSKVELANMTNQTFVNFIKRDSSKWSLYFKLLFNYLLICGVAIFLNIKPFCIVFNIVVLMFYCYNWAFDITIFILLYGISGVIYAVLILIPFFIVTLLLFLLISSVAIKINLLKKKFGKSCYLHFDICKCYMICILISAIFLFIECYLLSIIHSTIIVN